MTVGTMSVWLAAEQHLARCSVKTEQMNELHLLCAFHGPMWWVDGRPQSWGKQGCYQEITVV